MRRSYISLLVVMLASVLAVAACNSSSASRSTSDPTATSTAPAKAVVCDGVTTIDQALASLANANVSTTVGDVRAVQMKVANAVSTIQAQHPTDPQGFVSKVSAANDKLTEKLAGYPDRTPIGQTSTTIQDLKTRVADAQGKTAQLAANLGCIP